MDKLNSSVKRLKRAIKAIRRLKRPSARAWASHRDEWLELVRDVASRRDREKAVRQMAQEIGLHV